MDRFGIALAVVFASGALGCRDHSGGAAPAPSAPTESAAVAEAGGAPTWTLSLDPASRTGVEMPGLKEHIAGDTTHAEGTIVVTPHALTRSRGKIRIDLATFTTHTFGSDQDATQTRHARTWLEVQVGDRQREDMRWAEFVIRSIDGPSAGDLDQVQPRRDGDDDVRTVTMSVHGDLLLHGHRAPNDDLIEIAFHHRAGASIDVEKPTHVRIVSKQPMRVVLKEHDVRPRDPAGELLQWTTQLVSKVAEFADVTFELNATAAP